MKKILIISISILAAIAFATSCNTVKTTVTPAWGETVSIQASIPDDGSKVSLTPSGPDLHLAWEEGDALRVVSGSASEVFDIKPGFTDHEATFTGTAIEGETFDIIYPGIEANVGEATANAYVPQTQDGNGSTAHLKYSAALVGVDSYSEISFSDAWAAAHGGSLKRSGVIKLVLTLPESATTLESVTVDVNGTEMQLGLTNVDVSASEQVLTAYVTTPWDDVVLSAGEQFTVRVIGADKTVFDIAYVHPKDLTFAAGRMSVVTMSSGFEELPFFGGSGTSGDPWLIANAKHLQNVNAKLEDNTTKYFKLVADIDMEGESWTPLKNAEPYDKSVYFDGNSKTISNLGAALFCQLKGTVINLTLDKANVTTLGILSEDVLGDDNLISSVSVTNGKVNSSSSNVGGVIGHISGGTDGHTAATITNCSVTNTDVTGAGVVGGLVGFAEAKVIVDGCFYSGGTVTTSGRYCGGLVASAANYNSVFSNCSVENATIKNTATADTRTGGFAGQLQKNVLVKGCSVGSSEKKVTVSTATPADNKVLNSGGFVGVNYGTITKNGEVRCKAYAEIKSSNTKGQPLNLGGFVGFHRGTIEYCDAVVDMSSLQGQYIGGFAGYSVTDAKAYYNTITGSIRGNNYTGGFVGYVDNGSNIFTNNEVLTGTIVNGQSAVGGFAGYTNSNAGTFTDNTVAATLTVRANNGGGFVGWSDGGSFTDCSTSAAVTGNGTVIGGFVGYGAVVNMTRCSSTGNVVKNTSNGNQVGGFAGQIETCTLDGCYSTGSVTTTAVTAEYVGGFIGQVRPVTDNLAKIQNCYASGAVNGSGRWTGGFIGYIYRAADNCGNVEISKCHASGNVSVTGKSYVAGFIGRTYMVSGSHLTIEKCYATGNVSSNQSTASAFIGEIGEATNCTITDCYSTGNIIGSNQVRGGLIGAVHDNANTSAIISRCYSTCSMSDGNFRLGGLIANINNVNCSVDHCAAWNGAVVATAYAYNTNWSSGTIVGTAHPNCHLTDNYRNPDMNITMWWEPAADYNHPDVDGTTHPLVIRSNTTPYTYTEATVTSLGAPYQFPYHGKVELGTGTAGANKTLSQLASTTLGWSSEVWDFSGELPTLK